MGIQITLYFEYVSKHWFWLEFVGLWIGIISVILLIIFIPESPKWLYTWKNFSKSREILAYVAKFNGVDKDTIQDQITNASFVDDVTEEEQSKIDLDTSIVY